MWERNLAAPTVEQIMEAKTLANVPLLRARGALWLRGRKTSGGAGDASEKAEKAEMVRFYLISAPLIPNVNFIATGLLVKEEQEQAAFMF